MKISKSIILMTIILILTACVKKEQSATPSQEPENSGEVVDEVDHTTPVNNDPMFK